MNSIPDSPVVAEQPAEPAGDRGFFGQPRPLATIFGVEMWERFSFYGMQGILALYLFYSVADGGLGIPEPTALGIVGAYGGTVYLSTIVGAWLADRLLGSERVLFYGAIMIMCGHIALALIPGLAGVGVGLVLVAFGSGGLKANATAIVGTLYAPGDPRRDAGFSLFYLGINLGALIGPLLTGLLQSTLGFHWGFDFAAVGMGIGLIQYAFGRKRLPDAAREVADPLSPRQRMIWLGIAIAAVIVVVLSAITGLLTIDNLVTVVIVLTIIAAIAYFAVILSSKHVSAIERRRVYGFIPLFLTSVAFWSLYQQQFTVLTSYANSTLDRNVFGWEMPVPWVQSINPVFIILLSGAFAALWTKLGTRQPSTPVKFGLAAVGMGIAFLLFIPMSGGGPGSAPLLGLVGILFIFTVSELLLSPIGLSVTTKLAPHAFHTQMVALFFLSVALGTAISGRLAVLYDPANEVPYFGLLGLISIAVGALMLLASRWVLKLMAGVR